MLEGSFSAPLAWLFSRHAGRVRGVYGFELTEALVREHDQFIVELNWFIGLHEFGLVVAFIRAVRPDARIIFGGLYGAFQHAEVMRRHPVDGFIQGDNELPIRDFLDGVDLRAIRNFMGRGFCNPVTYRFQEPDYLDLEFDLDWIPSYATCRNPGDAFRLPHLITSKGGCSAIHAGCDYCMASKVDRLEHLYGRPAIDMTNGSLMSLLGKIEAKFDATSLYVTRASGYDFEGRHFDLDVTIELASRTTHAQVKAMFQAFRKVYLLLPVYEEGLSGTTVDASRYRSLIDLEDDDHEVRFYVLRKDARLAGIPPDHVMYADLAFPEAATWDFYMDYEKALALSRRFYGTCKRHFVDGSPRVEAANPSYMWQCFAFSTGYEAHR
jgi:hypothetical protein